MTSVCTILCTGVLVENLHMLRKRGFNNSRGNEVGRAKRSTSAQRFWETGNRSRRFLMTPRAKLSSKRKVTTSRMSNCSETFLHVMNLFRISVIKRGSVRGLYGVCFGCVWLRLSGYFHSERISLVSFAGNNK